MDEYQIPVSGEQINTTQIRTEQTQQQRDITRAINFQEDPWIKPEEFAGTLYLHNDRELLLLRSGKPEKKGEQKYSTEFTAIPWSFLQGVTLTRDGAYTGTLAAEFHLPGSVLRTEVEPANDGAVRFLESLAARFPTAES